MPGIEGLTPGRERAFLLGLLDQAIRAADPLVLVPHALPDRPRGAGRVVVVGAGKAAAGMAAAVATAWPDVTGVIAVPRGAAVAGDPMVAGGGARTGVSRGRQMGTPPAEGTGASGAHGPGQRAGRQVGGIEVVEAGHPIPDEDSVEAARRVLGAVRGLRGEDLVLCLISGGGSALLALPAPWIDLGRKQAITRELLRRGATIDEMNCVRRHLSGIKGGRLALAAAPARVVTLAISDVPGDDPGTIASGPTVADMTTVDQARSVLERYGIEAPEALSETPKVVPGEFCLVGSPRQSLEAAAEAARRAGADAVVLSDRLEGEAREVGARLAVEALRARDAGQGPVVLLSGGETTVAVRGSGRGGRNTELVLAAAVALGGADGVWVLSADTDGVDGKACGAGAVAGPDTLARAAGLGLDASEALARNDSAAFFDALGDLLVTGPTGTNVGDFRALLVMGMER